MKTIAKIATSLIVGLALSVPASAQWGNKTISGNGNVTTKTVSTGNYDAIKGVGSMDIHLEKGSEGSISVTTDDNLHEYIEIKTKGNDLVITTKKGYNLRTRKGIHVTVPFQDLNEVTITGSGDVETKDTISTNEMAVNVTGSGDIDLDIKATTTMVKVTGSGDIELNGSTRDLEVRISGSGDFKGYGLESTNTNVSVSGSGDAQVVANSSIVARVNGSGDVSYRGNPTQSDTKTSGSGSINSRN
jgi:hypothetical protein